MKTLNPLKIIAVLVISTLSYGVNAQNYSFTLIQNSDYNFTIAAISQFDSGSFAPITQSYGFVLVLPDGITISIDQALPSDTNETITTIPGTNVAAFDPTMSDKDLFLITTDTQGSTIAAHTDDQIIPLITLTVNGNPTSGEITILNNNSTLASAPSLNGALDAFFQVDIVDDSVVNFSNEFDKINGSETYSFDTLSTPEADANIALELFPNPASDVVFIKGDISNINQIEIFDIHGRRVLQMKEPSNKIDISQLETAAYLIKISSSSGPNKIIKMIKD